MRHLLIRVFCLTIAFASSLFLTAQTVESEIHYQSNSSHGALIFLENGNLIQAVTNGETSLISEWTTNSEEISTDVYPVSQYGHFISLVQISEDTLLTFGLDGKLILVSMSDQNQTPVGDLFPSLASENFRMINPEIRQIQDTLVVRFYSNRFDTDYEAKVRYESGMLYQDISQSPRRVLSTATSPTGQKAELSEGSPGFRLRVSDPSGILTLDTVFRDTTFRDSTITDSTTFEVFFPNKVLFESDEKLLLLGQQGVGQGSDYYDAVALFLIELPSYTIDTMVFGPPEFPGSTYIYSHELTVDQLILGGVVVNGDDEEEAFAMGIDRANNVTWSFQKSTRLEGSSVEKVLINPNDSREIFLVGNTFNSSVLPNENNAFLLKLSDLPTSTSTPTPTPLRLYPNPTNGWLTVEGLPIGIRKVEVIDLAGRVASKSVSRQTIDVRRLPAGTYFIKAETAGERFLGKFVKR